MGYFGELEINRMGNDFSYLLSIISRTVPIGPTIGRAYRLLQLTLKPGFHMAVHVNRKSLRQLRHVYDHMEARL